MLLTFQYVKFSTQPELVETLPSIVIRLLWRLKRPFLRLTIFFFLNSFACFWTRKGMMKCVRSFPGSLGLKGRRSRHLGKLKDRWERGCSKLSAISLWSMYAGDGSRSRRFQCFLLSYVLLAGGNILCALYFSGFVRDFSHKNVTNITKLRGNTVKSRL